MAEEAQQEVGIDVSGDETTAVEASSSKQEGENPSSSININNNVITTSGNESSKNKDSTPPAAAAAPPPLALGWTRVQRKSTEAAKVKTSTKRLKTDLVDGKAEGVIDLCQINDEDDEVLTDYNNEPNNKQKSVKNTEVECIYIDGEDDDEEKEGLQCLCARHSQDVVNKMFEAAAAQESTQHRILSGTAIVLLHEPDPKWFQLYLFPDLKQMTNNIRGNRSRNNSLFNDDDDEGKLDLASFLPCLNASNAWGLLAVQDQEIDKCMQCSEGGYRRVSLSAYPPAAAAKAANKSSSEKIGIEGTIEWTGGDMMHLTGPNARMNPKQLLLGRKAVPYFQSIFSSLWKRLTTEAGVDEASTSVLDLFPDVAVVIGKMELILPEICDPQLLFNHNKSKLIAGKATSGNYDEDDLWLE